MGDHYAFCFEEDPIREYRKENQDSYRELDDLAYFVAESYNISYSKTGILSGLWTNKLLKEECDVVFGTYLLHPGLAAAFSYSTLFESSTIHILSGTPKPESTFSTLDMDYNVLYGILIAITSLSVLSTLAERIISQLRFGNKSKVQFFDTFWMYFSSIFLEAFKKQISVTSKIMMTAWWLTLIIILSVIGGKMKADLTTSQGLNLDTFDDIIKHPKIKVLIPENSAISRKIKNSTEKVINEVEKRIKKDHGEVPTRDLDAYLDDIMEMKWLFIYEKLCLFEYLIHHGTKRNEGKFRVSSVPLFSVSYHIFAHDGISDEFMEKINQKAIFFASTRQFTPRHRGMLRQIDKYLYRGDHGFRNEISFLLSVYSLGNAISTIVLFLEIIFTNVMKLLNGIYPNVTD